MSAAYFADPDRTGRPTREVCADLTHGERDVLAATRVGGTVEEIADRAGYSSSYTAAALARLADYGRVEQTGQRTTRGRPAVVWGAR